MKANISKKIIDDFKKNKLESILNIKEKLIKIEDMASTNWSKHRAWKESNLPSYDEIFFLLSIVQNDFAKALLTTIYLTACRSSELVKLKYGDIRKVKNKDKTLFIFDMINYRNRYTKFKQIPIVLDSEGQFVKFLMPYFNLIDDPERVLFDISTQMVRKIVWKYLYMSPYTLRIIRINHLVNVFNINALQLKDYAGFESINTARRYKNKKWKSILQGWNKK